MNELTITAKVALANTFLMYFKAQAYHWNVEGKDFPQLHGFFGDLYEDVYGAIDTLAEEIRALGDYAPRSLEELYTFKTIDGANDATTGITMIQDLIACNDQVIVSLNKLFDLATASKEQGLADFAAGRLDAHKKHGWMLRATSKTVG